MNIGFLNKWFFKFFYQIDLWFKFKFQSSMYIVCALLLIPLVGGEFWWDKFTTKSPANLPTTISPLDALLHPTGTVPPDEFKKTFGELPVPPSYELPAESQPKSPFDSDGSFRSPDEVPLLPITELRLPVSPLDIKNGQDFESYRESVKKNEMSERSMLEDMSRLSPCQQDCAKGLNEAFDLILKSMSHVERYNQLCQHYNATYTCIAEDKTCGDEDHSSFDTITSGLRYMCVDQQLAFNATIECIDLQAGQVQTECEGVCNTKNLLMNWIMRSSIARGIQGGLSNGLQDGLLAGGQGALAGVFGTGNAPAAGTGAIGAGAIDSDFVKNMQQMSSELCTVGDCVLDCLRTKFNTRCEGSAGTLLSEAFVRPIAATQEKMSMMSPIMGMFIPKPCSFLVDRPELAKHRIDPTLDEELRRMYKEKEEERLKVLSDLAKEEHNLTNLFSLPDAPSPFDGNNDIESLVDLLYKSADDAKKDWEPQLERMLLEDSSNFTYPTDQPNLEGSGTTIASVNRSPVDTSETENDLDIDQLIAPNEKKVEHEQAPTQREMVEEGSGSGEEFFEGSGSGYSSGSGEISDDVVESSGASFSNSKTVFVHKIQKTEDTLRFKVQPEVKVKVKGRLSCRLAR